MSDEASGAPDSRWRPMMRAAPAARLAAFRVLCGAFAVGYLLVRLPYLLDVVHLDPARWDPPGPLAWLGAPLAPGAAQAVLGVTILVGVAFTAGWRFRITGPAFAVLLLGVLTYRNAWSHLFHTDNLLALHVLVVGLAPAADAWSADARRRRRRDAGSGSADLAVPADPTVPGVRYGWPLRLAALVTVLTYVVTGVAKLRYGGAHWLGGDSLLHQVAFDNARKQVLGDSVAPLASAAVGHPALFRPMGPLTLLVELGAPVALLGRRWAVSWVGAAWAFHVGILALMAIAFPYPLTLVAFAPLFRCERLLAPLLGRRPPNVT